MALGVVGGMQEWSRGSLGECGDGLGWLWGGCGAWEWSWGALGAFGVALEWLWGQSVGFGAALGLLWGHRAGSGGGFGDMGTAWEVLGWLGEHGEGLGGFWGDLGWLWGAAGFRFGSAERMKGSRGLWEETQGHPWVGAGCWGGADPPPLKPPALFAGDRGERGADHGHPVQEVPGHVGRLAGAHLLPGDGPRHHAPLLQQHPDRHQQLAAHRGSVGHGAGGRGGVPAPFWGQNGVLGVWGTPQSCVSW